MNKEMQEIDHDFCLTIEARMTSRGLRYFTEPENINGFDGTANGWGYRTIEKLQTAYMWHDLRTARKGRNDAELLLKNYPSVRQVLRYYFDPDWENDRAAKGETATIATMIQELGQEFPLEIAMIEATPDAHPYLLEII